jgi:N-acetylglucosaminyl-diphospho-decaprenol L-rhamnosyltransferase
MLATPPGPLAEAARERGVTVFTPPVRSMELRRSLRDRAGHAARLAVHGREAATLARDLGVERVVAWGMRSLLAVASALPPGGPRLLFAHNDVLPGPAIAAAVRTAARRADRVVALSHTVAHDLGMHGVEVIHPGVDLDAFRPGSPANPPYALLLGAIEPWKRPEVALEAVARVEDLRLVVAGEPIGEEGRRLLDRLGRRAAEPDLAGRVEVRGRVEDPREVLAGASVLLHCADREPFGIVMIEALASGVPVVAPASGGPTEIVTSACGRLYPPGDADVAARGVLECLRLDMRGAARERARSFSSSRTRSAWRDVLSAGVAASRSVSAAGRGGSGVPERRPASPALNGLSLSGHPGPPRLEPGALGLVTVTHNSAGDLLRLLRSVGRHLPDASVVVVDSGSCDGSVAVARDAGAEVVSLDNVGYGAAANAGVARCSAEVVVVLNPDVELVDSSLASLAGQAQPDRLYVPLVLLPDGRRQDVAHNGPAGWSDVAIALGPPAALPPPLRRRVQPWRDRHPRRVDWPVAACLVARTEALRRLGPFDPGIFLYAEDLDLGLRAREAGIETWFWPAARVVHHKSHATMKAFGGEPFERLARQRHAVVARRLGERAAARDHALQALTFANRVALKRLLGRPADRERRQLTAIRKAKAE